MYNYKRISATLFFLAAIVVSASLRAQSTARTIESFNKDWKFNLGDESAAKESSYNDGNWRSLQLPHDWSIEGKFDPKNPATTGGGALPGGIGWYRKTFVLPVTSQHKNVFIDFDGVYLNSEVWINGHYLGLRPYGYSSFRYDLTPYLKFGKEKNVIAVKVDNSQQPNSRWYSGSGIYRNVWLVTTSNTFVDHWGTYITTPKADDQSATVHLTTTVHTVNASAKNATLTTILYGAGGKEIQRKTATIGLNEGNTVTDQDMIVAKPSLWSIEHPFLYKAVTQVSSNGKPMDSYTTSFGIRYFVFDTDKGFLLNGKPVKINGVCDHHDLGCLGAAINTRALERQLEILKGMGCNGIRTSHNPPAPELLDLCDKMGFIVMDEAFDMWKKQKNPFDYHLHWDEWHVKDLQDMILRDRNHPSIFIWSIGNEIPEQGDSSGIRIANELSAIVRDLDKTRPITSACDRPDKGNNIIKSGALDLIGYNYHQFMYEGFQRLYPGQKFVSTESVSALMTRGHYDLVPTSDIIRRWPERWDKPFDKGNPDLTVSAYDNVSAPWGSTHEETWKVIKKYNFLSGQYIWTGFDYLGEPTPYTWPARSSYFGIIDLAGFPKDIYYMYKGEWTNKDVLHIFPHWNWKQGDTVDIWSYYNHADEVELFLDGKSLGTRKKEGDDLHVSWRVPFAPGVLKAVSRRAGKIVLSTEIKTAGAPAKLVLTADRNNIKADGNDLSFVKVTIADKDGNMVPNADNLVKFIVNGNGNMAGVDNGSETSMESFKANQRKAMNGLCLAVIRSNGKKGSITLKAVSDGLAPAIIILQSK